MEATSFDRSTVAWRVAGWPGVVSAVYPERRPKEARVEIMEASELEQARGRGRPTLMRPDAVLDKIRHLANESGLYRIHRTHSSLYARARRQFGSWEDG